MIKEIFNHFIKDKDKTKANGLKWSDSPGCFERHLQRRFQNSLFRKERRDVSQGDLFEAKDKDQKEAEEYIKQSTDFISKSTKLGKLNLLEVTRYVQEGLDPLIEKGIGISGNALINVDVLSNIEKAMLEQMDKLSPDGEQLVEKIRSLNALERNPYLIQSNRKDSPIPKNEAVSTLLCEDLNTIRTMGYVSRLWAPWEFSEEDVLKCLKQAINEGFDSKNAEILINAFREWPVSKEDVG
jgi:hypothetical protein